MPNALASGDRTIFWWKGNVTPPKDYKKWEDLIRNLTQHFKERYGDEEVKTWYFEVWNEPNLGGFWSGSKEDYWRLYDASAFAVKRADADLRTPAGYRGLRATPLGGFQRGVPKHGRSAEAVLEAVGLAPCPA